MDAPSGLQQWIHKLEEGEGGARFMKVLALFLALVAVTFVYHIREAKNFSAPEAMEMAQLGRNIANGNGYTTKFIRPLNISQLSAVKGEPGAVLKGNVPDMANPPVYPMLLAALMKVAPMQWEMPKSFWRYQPEVWIGLLNQALFFMAIFMVFMMGKRLFDSAVALISAILFAATELYWQFTTSGLPTMLLIVLVLGLVHLLICLEQQSALTVTAAMPVVQVTEVDGESAAEETPVVKSSLWFLIRAIGVGLMLAALMLTQYSFGLLAIPVLAWLLWVGGTRRGMLVGTTLVVFLLAVTPWLYRNYTVSNNLFGSAIYKVHSQTKFFPGSRLERSIPASISTELNRVVLADYGRKTAVNSAEIVKGELPNLTGNWVAALFLASLLVPFRGRTIARLRWFIVAAIITLLPAQALGRSDTLLTPMPLTSENLLVVLGPLLFAYGVAVFFIFIDQIQFSFPQFRVITIWVFALICSGPMIFALLPPRSFPINWPPYFPPYIQQIGNWMNPDELVMSDVPWAVAWYGNRKAIWTTLDYGNVTPSDFYKVNDYQHPIGGLYLTPMTTNSRFLMEMLKGGPDGAWGRFVLESILKTNVPTGFPLKRAPSGFFPDQVFLTDRSRWRDSGN